MSQVEHTKKHNSIDSKASLWNETPIIRIVNSVFLHVTLVLLHGKKTFLTWTERSDAKRWLIK